MLSGCPSHFFAHRRSFSEPHLQNLFTSPASDSTKSVYTSSTAATLWNSNGEGGKSPAFRRAFSQSNLMRNEDTHRSMRKWRCSRKNGLILAEDELAVHQTFNWEQKAHGNSTFVNQDQSEGGCILRPTKEEDKKLSIYMKSELLDRSPSVSRNSMVADSYSSLDVGPNEDEECSPAHPSETEYATDGKDNDRSGSTEGRSDGTDVYYQKMLESNPESPLLLFNYAKFLHEVQHDLEKAETYYKRALVASPVDGEILSMYANFIWETHNDVAQTDIYFRKAVEVSSEDCYVVASYAYFLWNSKDEGVEEIGQA